MDYNQLKAIEASWNKPNDNLALDSDSCGAWGEPISTAPTPILEAPKLTSRTARSAPPATPSQLESYHQFDNGQSVEQSCDLSQSIRTAPASKLSKEHEKEPTNHNPNPNYRSIGSLGDSHQADSPKPYQYSPRNNSTAPSASKGNPSGLKTSTLEWQNPPSHLDPLGVMQLFAEAKGASGIRLKSIGNIMRLTFGSNDLACKALQIFTETHQQGTLVPVLDEPSPQRNNSSLHQNDEANKEASRSQTNPFHSHQNIRTAAYSSADVKRATSQDDQSDASNFRRDGTENRNRRESVANCDWQANDSSGRVPPAAPLTPEGFSQSSIHARVSKFGWNEQERNSDRHNDMSFNSHNMYGSRRSSGGPRNSQNDTTPSRWWNTVGGSKPSRRNWEAHVNEPDDKAAGAPRESFYGSRDETDTFQEPSRGIETEAKGRNWNELTANVRSAYSGWGAPVVNSTATQQSVSCEKGSDASDADLKLSWDSTDSKHQSGWEAPIRSESKPGWNAPAQSTSPKAGWDAPIQSEPSKAAWEVPIQSEPSKAGWDAPIQSEPLNARKDGLNSSSDPWQAHSHENKPDPACSKWGADIGVGNSKLGEQTPARSHSPAKKWSEFNSSPTHHTSTASASENPKLGTCLKLVNYSTRDGFSELFSKLCIRTDDLFGMAVLTPTILYLKFNSPCRAEDASQKYLSANLNGFSQIVEPPSYVHFVTKDQMSGVTLC